ncbi:hypothetical protein ACLOJK_006526 [Asimina triloba]
MPCPLVAPTEILLGCGMGSARSVDGKRWLLLRLARGREVDLAGSWPVLRWVSTHLHWSLADRAGHGERVDEGRSASSPGYYGRTLSPLGRDAGVVVGGDGSGPSVGGQMLDGVIGWSCSLPGSLGSGFGVNYSHLPMGRRYEDCPPADRWIYPLIWCSMAI